MTTKIDHYTLKRWLEDCDLSKAPSILRNIFPLEDECSRVLTEYIEILVDKLSGIDDNERELESDLEEKDDEIWRLEAKVEELEEEIEKLKAEIKDLKND